MDPIRTTQDEPDRLETLHRLHPAPSAALLMTAAWGGLDECVPFGIEWGSADTNAVSGHWKRYGWPVINDDEADVT